MWSAGNVLTGATFTKLGGLYQDFGRVVDGDFSAVRCQIAEWVDRLPLFAVKYAVQYQDSGHGTDYESIVITLRCSQNVRDGRLG